MQVLKNVYMVFGGIYSNISNIFVIKGKDALVMTDTAEDEEELAIIDENIKYWGLSDYPITHVLISHQHYNHIGNAHILRKRGAKIVAGPGDAESIASGDKNGIVDFGPFLKQIYTPCPVDIIPEDGEIIHAPGLDIEAIRVPGHTDGSMFYKIVQDGKSILFTGDVLNVLPDCSGAILGWQGGPDYNREIYFETIKRFSQMPCDIILPGHYQLCMQDGWKILQDAYAKALIEWRVPSISNE